MKPQLRINMMRKVGRSLFFLALFLPTPLLFAQGGSQIYLNPPCRAWINTGGRFIEPGYTAVDSMQNNVTSNVVVSGILDSSQNGKYILSYCLNDSGRPPVCVYRTVLVGDSSWMLNADATLNLQVAVGSSQDTLSALMAHFTQTFGYTVGVDSGMIRTDTLGLFGEKIVVIDSSCGNFWIHLQVRVKDLEGPIISLNGPDTFCLEVKTPFVDPWVNVSDNYYPSGVLVVTRKGAVNPNVVGTYLVVYTATDPSGNSSQISRLVQVVNDMSNCGFTGLEMEAINRVSIFPVPASDKVIINNFRAEGSEITLASLSGASFRAPVIQASARESVLDVCLIPNGYYFIKLTKGDKQISVPVVIAH